MGSAAPFGFVDNGNSSSANLGIAATFTGGGGNTVTASITWEEDE